ncbi:FliC/FljB family flagellin [Chromohalobacter israelensis]|uniref:FliC/FljB family flagellin n=1 Tax=Chromohalobacter israelensis TaxID=141390 RepID=UPI000FFF4A85|nr:FliC/FljB family flagellin [Chromohalobacter salexigens]RXE46004.1 flagellin [Chromohalobacter salexigens]
MAVINTNITAMIGQQNLNQSQNALSTSMERLSSGLRINSAADDAAGQAIANRMSSQITGLSQAQRNANDGISVAQTTEGALNQVNDNLQRVRELTVQAQNGTNSQEDLNSIQDEINQRLGEIDRISEETSFNGVDVLASDQEISIQVGSEDGQTITMNLKAINSETLDLDTFSVAKGIDTSAVASAATSTITTTTGGTTSAFDTSALTAPTGASGDGSWGDVYESTSGTYYAQYTGDTASPAVNGYYELSVGSSGAVTVGSSTSLSSTDGSTTSTYTYGGTTSSVSLQGSDAGNVYAYTGTEDGAPEYVIQDTVDGENVYYEASIDDEGNVTRGAEYSTTAATDDPLSALDAAISQVDSQRSELGAMQNRFDSAITNLSTTETNLTSARSRIEDADYADEVSNMTRNQILQQAGTSVLAQANQLPQNALSLLG